MLFDPKIKPRIWNLQPGMIAYSCARMGLPIPVLAMPFWEGAGGKLFDYSGNQNTGIFYGNAAWKKNAIYFPGNTDYVRVEDSPSLKDFSALTLEALIYPTAGSGSGWGRIIHKAQGSTGDDYALTQRYDSHVPILRINTNTGVTTIEGNSGMIPNSKWYHLVGTWNGNAMKIYLDGKVDAQGNRTGILDDSNDYLAIGRHVASAARAFNGYIAYVRVFSVALSIGQVQILRDNSFGMYEPTRDYRIWSFVSGGETFYKTITGNQPTSTGTVASISAYKQTVVGNVPNPAAVIVRHVDTQLIGNMPTTTATIIKKTEKKLAGEQPTSVGDVTYKSVYKQAAAGNVPASAGSLSSTIKTVLALAGNMPASLGGAIKRISKMLAGSQPATTGSIVKQIEKNVAGEQPAPVGSVSHTTKTFLSGIMGNIAGVLDTILNPIPSVTVKLCKLIGSCFKKFLG